jgi:AAA domain
MVVLRPDSRRAVISHGRCPGSADLGWPCHPRGVLVRRRCGLAWLDCTAAAACGYGTGVGQAATASDVHGFPAALTSFIGRVGPAREVAGLLERHRLVTVTGPGGTGKTRLAGEVARRVAGRFADGVWLAELAPVQDPARIAAVVTAALGVREQPGVPVAEVLARVLARQQLLLVLDNCEHVVDAAQGSPQTVETSS